MLPADYEIVEEHIKESFSEELSDGILRMFSRTSSFRPALSHIMHILNMQEKYGTKSVNDTVLKIIESHARANGNDDRIPEKVQIQKKRKRNNFLSEGAKEKRQQDTEERKEEKQEEEAEDIIL